MNIIALIGAVVNLFLAVVYFKMGNTDLAFAWAVASIWAIACVFGR